jgi:hypothetical protein
MSVGVRAVGGIREADPVESSTPYYVSKRPERKTARDGIGKIRIARIWRPVKVIRLAAAGSGQFPSNIGYLNSISDLRCGRTLIIRREWPCRAEIPVSRTPVSPNF